MRKYVELLMQEKGNIYIFQLDRMVIIHSTLFDYKLPSTVSAVLYTQGQEQWFPQWMHWLLLARSTYKIWCAGLMWFTQIHRRAAHAQSEGISIVLNCHPAVTLGKHYFSIVTLSAWNLLAIRTMKLIKT